MNDHPNPSFNKNFHKLPKWLRKKKMDEYGRRLLNWRIAQNQYRLSRKDPKNFSPKGVFCSKMKNPFRSKFVQSVKNKYYNNKEKSIQQTMINMSSNRTLNDCRV